jgi:hypothetical protein
MPHENVDQNLLDTSRPKPKHQLGRLKRPFVVCRNKNECKDGPPKIAGALLTGDKTFGFAPAESITAKL